MIMPMARLMAVLRHCLNASLTEKKLYREENKNNNNSLAQTAKKCAKNGRRYALAKMRAVSTLGAVLSGLGFDFVFTVHSLAVRLFRHCVT
jgi:hypothetical protein